ncbi:MAG: hypothetical protein IPK72_15810 [Candidatus Eisenbacteria bacterium]|nr:hypothetical protein [Candidatus Eisenbacteria bacterium]
MDRRVVLLPALALACAAANPSWAQSGAAGGRVSIIETAGRAYGFSSYSGNWTMTPLDTAALDIAVGTYLGFVRTEGKIHSYNSTNDRWYATALIDPPSQLDGHDIEGATSVAWGLRHAYGIATPWSLWKVTAWQVGEHCLGGGSAGNFALVWTNARAHAYSSTTGQWTSQLLGTAPLGGIASGGLGIVWTMHDVFAFDPLASQWNWIDLGDPFGVSAVGSGNTAVVWSDGAASAYSALLNTWVPLEGLLDVFGGDAGGDVALVWGHGWAYAFMAATGTWTPLTFPVPSSTQDPAPSLGDGFSVGPNPAPGGALAFTLPRGEAWTIGIYAADGGRVHQLEAATPTLAWDGRDITGRRVPAGTYWVRAESASRIESRRVVLLP